METITLPTNDPAAISQAGRMIAAGDLIAFPTDTVYGLASTPFSGSAIEKIFLAKGRDFNKAIAILVGSPEQIPQVANSFPEHAQVLASRFWPGALTLIVPIASRLPKVISPFATIGVRMPNHPFTLALLQALGPLATTSANISGQADARTAKETLAQLSGKIPLVLDGGPCPGGVPSTVVDCSQEEIHILREGAIRRAEVEQALGRQN